MGGILLALLKERGYTQAASFPISDHPNSLEHSISSWIEQKKTGEIKEFVIAPDTLIDESIPHPDDPSFKGRYYVYTKK